MDLLCPKTKERCKREKIGRYNWNWSLNREPESRHLWTKFRLRLSRNVMDLQCKKTKTKMQRDFCNNYLPKIEFFKTRSGLSELRKKKTPLGHLLNETQFPFSSSTNFLERKEGIFPFLWTKLCSLWRKNLTGVIVPITCKEWVTMWQNGHFSSCNQFPSE